MIFEKERFASLNAHHDSGIKGINTEIAQRLIDILAPHGRIYITSERPLEPQFEQYRIRINPLDMHHVMAFASLYIGDSQTMAAEAGVLGTPFVRFNDFVGRIGYLRELEDTYHLGFGVHASPLESTKTQINVAFDKWIVKDQTTPLIGRDDHCLRSPQELEIIGGPEESVINIDKEGVNQKSGDSVCCEQHLTSISADSVIVSELPLQNHPLSSDSVPSTESSPYKKDDLQSSEEKSPKKIQACGAEAMYEIVERLVAMDPTERQATFQERRERMLAEKIDCAKFLTYFIEGYPATVKEVRGADKSFWERFM